MKALQMWKKMAGVLAAASLLLSGCGSSGGGATKVSVSLSASALALFVNQTYQIAGQAVGSTDQSITYSLSYVPTATPTATPTACPTGASPNPNCGTLSAVTSTSTTTTTGTTTTTNTIYTVTYTAPPIVPNPAVTVYIVATANADKTATAKVSVTLDSGIRVSITPTTATIGTGESFQFTASLTNDPVPNDVNWSVTQTNAGTVSANGLYTAPASVPSPATATVVATSKLDPTQTASATVTIVVAAAPTFTGVSPAPPATVPQGALFQDVYLTAGNLRSTSTVTFNGAPVSAGQLKIVNSTLARVRLNSTDLLTAGTFAFAITGATSPAPPNDSITIVPVRPALLSANPDSTVPPQAAASITLDGGYFGPGSSPLVTAQFNGNPRPITGSTARQLAVTLNPGDLNLPGLYAVSVNNSSAPQPMAAGNFAVQPDPAANGPFVAGLLSLKSSPTDTPAPSAIAVDTTIGAAIVANTGNNTVQLLNLNGAMPALFGAQIPLLGSPTGVAVDEERHIAAVAVSNTAGTVRNITLVDLVAGAAIAGATIDLTAMSATSAASPLLPFSVGLDPVSGRGIVAFSKTNIGAIFNVDPAAAPVCIPGLGTAPYCVTGVVTLNTGTNPQIAFQPRLRWAFVTPGGSGLMSVVDLGAAPHQAPITASTGAKRSGNVVTITTATAHGLDPTNLGAVLISGVADASFNGSFTVTSVVDANNFTYSQTAADATSGGGQINFSKPLQTYSISPSIRGIAINPLTSRAVLADAGGNSTSILSTLDQTNTGIAVGHPVSGAGFQPFNNVAVVVKPGTIGATGVDTITLLDPTVTAQIGTLPRGVLAEISTTGTGSGAVAVDPARNWALVANAGSHDISVVSLGTLQTPQVASVWIPLAQRLFPQGTTTSASALSVKIFGAGFSGSPQVRLDGTVLSGATLVNSREIDVNIPASFLAAPRRYALDVVVGSNFSNVTDFTVVGVVDMTSASCLTPLPAGVAIDEVRDKAVVANSGCNSISIIDLNTAAAAAPIAVGTAPVGVATIPRLGLAVVTNSNMNLATGSSNGAGTISIVNVATASVQAPISLGTDPTGVAINQDTGIAYAVNTGSNTLSAIDLTATTPTAVTGAVDQNPISIAVDPNRNIAVVGAIQQATSQGVLDVVDTSLATPAIKGRVNASPSLPTGVVYDPANTLFYAVSSLSNSFYMLNADTGQAQGVRVGVNPTSLAYNPQSATLVTVNSASNTLSFVDTLTMRTRETLGFGTVTPSTIPSNPQFGVAIHPRTNLAVITDANNNRVLLLPLPR
ncbi:MAG: hypothetical protein LAN84_03050 [Acidobacteriia bacterium]|nr:hypothetical protein [Terriglobia bacterium]